MASAEKIGYVLALGSNVGDRHANLQQAIRALGAQTEIVKESRILETWPILIRAQGRFLNQGIYLVTEKQPDELLAITRAVEQQIGRKKRIKNGPREIDIDIIWSSVGRIVSPTLRVPHPFNRAREWVRQIMQELKPDAIDAETGVVWQNITGKSIMNVNDFVKKKAAGEKITVVTCYDYAFARLIARTSLDAILVGDSLGNVIQGNPNTLAVTVDDMIYHARMVRRGAPQAFIVVDMPFMSYQTGVADALRNAGRLIKETGADAVKLEGGENIAPQIRALVESGIPVMGHLGLTPQSVLAFGGYKVQGKSDTASAKILGDAKAIEAAGVFGLVLEMVPVALTAKISQALTVPTIGIGAGDKADGQVLVLNDLLGLDPDFAPRFVRKYADLSGQVFTALENYAADVRQGNFPAEKESFH
ncbi:MAG: 3-methyl-2-oxobutanoate hydroxymethyltransferase [Spirochaetes bacterium]|nr:3-methyl-2-oxobutanoate hydroxymethyltransferase [Spirochaetota bacterium]